METTLTPKTVIFNLKNHVWWKCNKGHSWKIDVSHRTRTDRTNCPYCAGRILEGENDLYTKKPELMQEWDFDKNSGINPKNLALSSNMKVWWKCNKGHPYLAIISDRAKNGSGCPYCSGRKPIKGVNDVMTIFPELEKEWDYEKNEIFLLNDVSPGSGKKAYWKCQKGHSWKSVISERVKGKGCPYCAGNKVIAGENDLQTNFTEVLVMWDYEKNDILPSEITSYSSKKVFWKC